ncbi:hypothetical protein ACFYW1_04400 [Streptomyces sp. NPDC002669]|uniref:hypothetical protein n=1 Tax=Streptomyces sp. NPDC002669 TaxID=3364658 RepID=UPI0036972D35
MSTTRFSAFVGVVCAAVLCVGCSSQAEERPKAAAPTADSPSPSATAAPTRMWCRVRP